jgi:hypothetical protein
MSFGSHFTAYLKIFIGMILRQVEDDQSKTAEAAAPGIVEKKGFINTDNTR